MGQAGKGQEGNFWGDKSVLYLHWVLVLWVYVFVKIN